MTSIMSYQRQPPFGGNEMDFTSLGTLPTFHPGPDVSGQEISPSAQEEANTPQSTDPRYGRSYTASSTDSMPQDMAAHTLGSGGQGEKKRNKLGYHRTSIACSHCRRRKIRCIASPDVQNKCINCIRLKKECTFHPVDQPPPNEGRSKTKQPSLKAETLSQPSPQAALNHPASVLPTQTYEYSAATPMSNIASAEPAALDVSTHSANAPSTQLYDVNAARQPMGPSTQEDGPLSAMPFTDLGENWSSYPHDSPIAVPPAQFPQTNPNAGAWYFGQGEAALPNNMAWGAPHAGYPHVQQGHYMITQQGGVSMPFSESFTDPMAMTMQGIGREAMESPMAMGQQFVQPATWQQQQQQQQQRRQQQQQQPPRDRLSILRHDNGTDNTSGTDYSSEQYHENNEFR